MQIKLTADNAFDGFDFWVRSAELRLAVSVPGRSESRVQKPLSLVPQFRMA